MLPSRMRIHLVFLLTAASAGAFGAETAVEETPPAGSTPAEKHMLSVLEDMDRNQRAGSMAVPERDGRLLRLLAESMGAKHVVELGTSFGYSGVWWCLALQTTGGKLTTYEIDPKR